MKKKMTDAEYRKLFEKRMESEWKDIQFYNADGTPFYPSKSKKKTVKKSKK